MSFYFMSSDALLNLKVIIRDVIATLNSCAQSVLLFIIFVVNDLDHLHSSYYAVRPY